MPRAVWPLARGRPVLHVVLRNLAGGQALMRTLLADTGAGARHSWFDLILKESDCLSCGGLQSRPVQLGGAYAGLFPVYIVRVQLPVLGFDSDVRAVGVPAGPRGLDGIACFPFLSRFTYGNFGDPILFGLEN